MAVFANDFTIKVKGAVGFDHFNVNNSKIWINMIGILEETKKTNGKSYLTGIPFEVNLY
jgi:hypothetical protein